MGRRRVEDPKVDALREARTLNPRPEAVVDEGFTGSEFFDARDLVQVKYEMVRRVRGRRRAGGARGVRRSGSPGRRSTRRPRRWPRVGWPALVPARPGPRRAHKLTERGGRSRRGAAGRRRLAAAGGPGRADWPSGSGCGCIRARSNGRWRRRRSRKSEPRNRMSRPLGLGSSTATSSCGPPPSAAAPTAGGWGSPCSRARAWPGGSAPPRPAPNPCRHLPGSPRAVVPACPACPVRPVPRP